MQLLLATHSVEKMVNRLGRQRDAVLLSVDRATSTAVSLHSEHDVLRALDEFCDLSPFHQPEASFAARCILFYEGPTDLRILEACARILSEAIQSGCEASTVHPSPAGGRRQRPAPRVLQKILTPALFPKINARHPVRAAMALDRDFVREQKPAEIKDMAPHLKAIEVVWSRHCIESLFLEPACLLAWLSSYLPTDGAVPQVIEQAIEAANADTALKDAAYEGRYPFHRRPDAENHRMATERTRARQRAPRSAPPPPSGSLERSAQPSSSSASAKASPSTIVGPAWQPAGPHRRCRSDGRGIRRRWSPPKSGPFSIYS